MPILLDDIQSAPAVKVYNPKFFDIKLTGRGGNSNVGLLSMKNNPVNIPGTRHTETNHYDIRKRTYRNGQTTVTMLPVNSLPYSAWNYMQELERPDLTDMVKVAAKGNAEIYMHMPIHAITLDETVVSGQLSGAPQTNRTFIACYQMQLFLINDQTKTTHKLLKTANQLISAPKNENHYALVYTSNPLADFTTGIGSTLQAYGFQLYLNDFNTYIASYDLHNAVTKRSEEWQTSIDKIIAKFFENIHKYYSNDPMAMQYVRYTVKYLMDYNIPLDLYKHIYQALIKNFTTKAAADICKQNLNLLLSDTLNNLNNNKGQLITFKQPNPAVQMPPSIQHLSPEQLKAVSSTEPLILVQAGAGTGKSTLILGRIDYLIACGVDPADITVLSFTNAAANHITEKNDQVHSMTIARMIHEIYSANFTGHELSSLETIMNSLDIYYPTKIGKNNTLVNQFKNKLHAMSKNEANNFTEMNNFIEDNYDDVIAILDTIHQTSLELEIIICYQKIDTFKEPSSITSKFLIIDEVQDNSIFEFVYTLKYIDKHKESMFIVGDCSQTLFEFRASNPRALNILEGSGTFATYQLNINYRSNQEILEFANVALQNIEANQYANIQLHANSLASVTEQSFLDRVHFNYERLNKITDFNDALPSIFAREINPYIKDCLARGEQVAFLSFTRHDVETISNILDNQFPGVAKETLVPKKMYNTVVMSNFIKRYWDSIKFAPIGNIMMTITQEILQNLPYLVYNDQKALPRIREMLDTWRTEEGPTIQTWIYQYNHQQITQDELLNMVKENMLQFEIRKNAIKQALLSAQNEKNKQSDAIKNAKFLLSTIHSAKGLEFDNVVVFHRNENNMEEDKKRMYYVAFTRAMKSEYILTYDTVASPQILADYNTVLQKLHSIAPAPNSPLNVIKKNKRVKI